MRQRRSQLSQVKDQEYLTHLSIEELAHLNVRVASLRDQPPGKSPNALFAIARDVN